MRKPGARYEITAIRRVRCPLCGSAAGQWCTSRGPGEPVPIAHPHDERIAEVLAARKARRQEP